MRRKTRIAPGEHYHIFNRGNRKQAIFLDDRDRARFLFLILALQSSTIVYNISDNVDYFTKHRVFSISERALKRLVKERTVELVEFILMPNHFHLIMREFIEGGIAKYMQRVLNAYTKYFNTRYGQSGHLFQGPYRDVHINDNNQLLYLSAYIHRNSREIAQWKNKECAHQWSSYTDYVAENRWGTLLSPNIILDQFRNAREYEIFVRSSTAKLCREELGDELCID